LIADFEFYMQRVRFKYVIQQIIPTTEMQIAN